MSRSPEHLLLLRIKDPRGLFQRTLRPGERLRIGQAPHNDIVVFDGAYPKSAVLIENRGDLCRLYIHPRMSGVITYKDSTLAFQDLILQEILPRQGEFFVLTMAPGRKGTVHVGEAQIAFAFDGVRQTAASLPAYGWRPALRRALRQDMGFKVALVLLSVLEVFWAAHLRNIDLPPEAPPAIEKVPQRFARFVIAPTPAAVPTVLADVADVGGDRRRASEGQPSGSNSESVGDKAVTSAGLLGLIGGSGSTGKSSAAVDFLLDQGLVKQLDEVIGSTAVLQGRSAGSGRGSGSGDGLDALIAAGQSGGIDDLIGEGGVKSVELQKQGNVNIQAPQAIRGSEQARGQRTAESVMAVINAQRGRVMYTYNKFLRLDPELRGKVSLDVMIAADGRVTDVRVVESSIDNADFIRDLIAILKSLRFPLIDGGEVTVNVPFVFNRVG